MTVKRVKKVLFVFFCLFLAGFTGCGNGEKKETKEKNQAPKFYLKISIPVKEKKEVPLKTVKPEKIREQNAEKVEPEKGSSFIRALLVPSLKKKEENIFKDKDFYDPNGRIDPFSPLVKDTPKKIRKKKKRTRPKTPLEKLDLSQLKLVAIIESSGGETAVLEEASGKGYVVEVGTYVGLNFGQITEIKSDRIIIKETIEDIIGKSVTKESVLKIQKPVGE